MSSSIAVLPVAVVPPAETAAAPPGAENPGDGANFEQALAGELGITEGGETPVAAEMAPPATAGDPSTELPALAEGGKDLPLGLPPALTPPPTVPVEDATDAAASSDVADTNLADLIAASARAIWPAAEMLAATPSHPDAPANVLTPELTAREGRPFSAAAGASPVTGKAAIEMPREIFASVPGPAATPELAVNNEAFKNALHELTGRAAAFEMPPAPIATPMAVAVPAGGLASPANHAPANATTTLAVPLGEPRWGEALGQQVVWAVGQGVQRADLHLSPPELGPLTVRISLDQDQASISFSSAHAGVRDAVEAALPRLRDMLGSQGIALADVNVSHQHSSHAQRDPGGDGSARGPVLHHGEPDRETTAPVSRAIAAGVLDVYA